MLDWLKKHKIPVLLLLILTLLTYGNSLNNAFLSDDLAEIVNNPNIGSFVSITTHPFGFIRHLLYFLAFHIGGLNQVLFRSINIFFHTGSVLLIYVLFQFFFARKTSLILAAIFAVHPAISEAVVWISGGMYPQYSFFFLLSFILYILSQTQKNNKYYRASIIAFLFSFMSHPQMPLSLFLIFPLWEFSFGNLKNNWKKTIPFFTLTIVYLLVALSSLPERETTLKSMHYQSGGIDNPFVLIPVAITSYLELILLPKALTLYHSELSFDTINFIIRAAVTLLLLIITLFSFKKNKFIFFWLSFFFIALSPTLTPFRLNWVVAERYLYLPILGILALVGLGFEKAVAYPKLKRVAYITIILIVIILSIRTITRNIDWKNEDNLWIATGKTSPSSPNTHNNLGDVYGRLGDKQKALQEFQRAIELKPNYGDAYHNLANTYRELNQTDKALENYQNALKYNPNLWQSYQNIAAIHFERAKLASSSAKIAAEEYKQTLDNIQKAIQINPNNINLVNNLGIVYLASDNKAKAKEIFTLVLSADPNNQFASAGLAEANK